MKQSSISSDNNGNNVKDLNKNDDDNNDDNYGNNDSIDNVLPYRWYYNIANDNIAVDL